MSEFVEVKTAELSRQQFEAWALSCGQSIEKESGVYVTRSVDCLWVSWRASREAVVVELPAEDGMDGHLWAPDVVTAIEAAGLKVAP